VYERNTDFTKLDAPMLAIYLEVETPAAGKNKE
jgi:hypothetical protein